MSDITKVPTGTGPVNANSPPTEASCPEETMATLPLEGVEDESDPESQPNEDAVDGDLAPSRGEKLNCSAVEAGGATTPPGQYISSMDEKLRPIEELVQHLLNKADEFQTHHIHRYDHLQKPCVSHAVSAFLRSYQPYLVYLESNAHSVLPQRPPLPTHIRTRLLDFSQQLCSRLEQLVLTFNNHNLLSMDETEPESVSHFYAGRCQLGGMTLSTFLFPRPAPYLPRPAPYLPRPAPYLPRPAPYLPSPAPYLPRLHTGLFKRMRWNLERPRERPTPHGPDLERPPHGLETERETEGETERETEGETAMEETGAAVVTEYYFLCYEDEEHTRGEEAVRMWSIGQWVQTHPDPETDDLYDWVLCPVPQGRYLRLVCLGSEEPSACAATDCLVGVLLSRHGPEQSSSPETAAPGP